MSNKNKNKKPANTSAASATTEREFLSLKTEEAQALFDTYRQGTASTQTPDQIRDRLQALLSESYAFPPDLSSRIAARLFVNFSSGTFQQTFLEDTLIFPALTPTPPKIQVSLQDYQKFTELTAADPDISFSTKKLLFSFIVFYRLNFHPSGWIRYDKKNIFFLAGTQKFATTQQERMTAYLHTHYALNMRVVGSNQPTPCYTMDWLQDQPPVGSEINPLITLGDLTPEDVDKIVAKTTTP